jgi:hypothetical protein
VPLVKAVQELSKMNNNKNAKIDLLQKQADMQQKINADLQKQINELKTILQFRKSNQFGLNCRGYTKNNKHIFGFTRAKYS